MNELPKSWPIHVGALVVIARVIATLEQLSLMSLIGR
jgi:hypothetical protein